MYLLICYHFIEMLLAPSYQSRKCWHQRFACLCQGILHSGWNLRIDLTMNEMALLQILQRLRKHLLRTIRHQTTDLVKAQYTSLAGVKHVEHQHGPLVTETTHYLPDWTSQVLCFNICHFNLRFDNLRFTIYVFTQQRYPIVTELPNYT